MGQEHPWCPTGLSPGATTFLSPYQRSPFLHLVLQNSCLQMHDTSIQCSSSSAVDLEHSLQKDLNAVQAWMNANKLKLNNATPQKCDGNTL